MIKTYNKVKEIFPTEGSTTSVVVEAEDVRAGAAADGIANLMEQAEASDTFLAPPTIDYSEDNTVAEIGIATPGEGAQTASVTRWMNSQRTGASHCRKHSGSRSQRHRRAAASVDFREQLDSRLLGSSRLSSGSRSFS